MASARFQRPVSRRGFLTVGTIGLGGLTLADVLRLRGPGRLKSYAAIDGQGRLGDPHLPARRDRPSGDVRSQAVRPDRVPGRDGLDRDQDRGRAVQRDAAPDGPGRRQAHGHPLDDPRRGGPRARHAQHVHGLSAQPGACSTPAWAAWSPTSTARKNNLPPYVCIPNQPNVYAGTGYLSSSFSPFSLGRDPADPGFQVQDLNLPGGINEPRFTTRRNVLDAVNAHFAKKEKSDNIDAMDTFYQRAYSLISSQKAREAFNIDAEPAKIRDEYGRNAAGQRLLMARRLVAAGVRFVTVDYGGWDMHNQIVAGMNGQMPPFDQAFAALIRDLDRTGLLERTVVMVSSEFGRTPKINKDAGRDHWPKVFSVVLAGGGIKKG